jgi:O-antigen ligase
LKRVLTPVDRSLLLNPNFIFLSLNCLLVIIGYALSKKTDGATIDTMKLIKSAVLIFSCILLFGKIDFRKNVFGKLKRRTIFLFTFWLIFMTFFSEDVGFSIRRAFDFLAPFLYIYITLHTLLERHDVVSITKMLILVINVVYSIPIINFIFSGTGFFLTNLYDTASYRNIYFFSNQLGWSGCIFLLSSIDILQGIKIRKTYRIYLICLSLVSLYLIVTTGNRSSWISLIISIIVLIVRYQSMRRNFKVLLLSLVISFAIWTAAAPESSINMRYADTEDQIQNGEERFNTAKMGFETFNNKKILWLTGAGMFNYDEVAPFRELGSYHNSYLEIFFGGGIILFILFCLFMVFRPVGNYFKYYSKIFLIFPPLAIIPFFESNLTGGQFLFYPWFMLMLLFNLAPPDVSKNTNKHVRVGNYPLPRNMVYR